MNYFEKALLSVLIDKTDNFKNEISLSTEDLGTVGMCAEKLVKTYDSLLEKGKIPDLNNEFEIKIA